MRTLKSYVGGHWYEADAGFENLVDPSTEEPIARISSRGVDMAEALAWARETGGPALRELSFAERGALLKAMAGVLRENRDELLDLSRRNNGTTLPDGSFDVDGGGGTLAYYAALGKRQGERKSLVEGDGIPLAKTPAFWGRHLLVPRRGVAVHINAFNFPVWGFAEKAACALLAGMPVITKPASATALVAERCVQLMIETGVLPEGALQIVCGGAGDLLERLGPQDVVAFTGSADTARYLSRLDAVAVANPRFNVEADSLNAAVLGPDVAPDSELFGLFVKEVSREMTQKTGQKCTAVRRILVPVDRMAEATEALAVRLGRVVTGNPADESVRMGPLATARQLEDALTGLAELRAGADLVCGTGERCDGVGNPAGKGFFLAPTLLRARDATANDAVHEREVFGPVATLIPYDGSPEDASVIVALGGGTLVGSAYSDDADWVAGIVDGLASTTGRLYLGSSEAAPAMPGSGVALPQTLHGGPGRAGGGEELGGLQGVKLYMQRLALQGSREMVEGLAGE